MAQILLTTGGRYILAGGTFLSIVPGAPPLTSLTLLPFAVSNTAAKPVYQRRAGTDYGNVWVPFAYTGGSPSNVQARVVMADSPTTVIKDWATLTSISTDGAGNGLGCLSLVPIGCDYFVQIRDGTQPTTISNGSQRWGVGVRMWFNGQSNMVNTMSMGAYQDIVPGNGSTELAYWQLPNSGSSYFTTQGFIAPNTAGTGSVSGGGDLDPAYAGCLSACRIASAALSAKYGRKIPVCGILWAVGQHGLETFLIDGSEGAMLANSGTSGSAFGLASPQQYGGGDFEIVMQHVGEQDSNTVNMRATYKGYLHSFYQQCLNQVAPFGRTAANLTFMPAVLGVYQSAAPCLYVEDIRAAVLEFETEVAATWPNARVGWTSLDLIPSAGNAYHFTDKPSQLRSHRRMMQSAIHALAPDLAPYSGRGPQLSGAVTRNGLVATFTVTHEGGTGLQPKTSGSPITGWYSNTAADFSGTDIAVTAAISGASTVAVTFPSGTVFPVYVKHAGGHIGTLASQFPDTSNIVYDNVPYPFCKTSSSNPANIFTGTDVLTEGFPLLPTPTSIKVT